MLKGIQLTLLIGPAVPVPAPASVVEAVTQVQINNGGRRSGFQLTFSVSKRSPLLTTMLPAGYFDPIVTRVVIVVTLNGMPNVLMDGVVTRHELAPSSEPGQSTLTITGEDLSVLMDIVEIPRLFPAMPEVAQLYLALAPYAAFGIVPLVIPPFVSNVTSPMGKAPTQMSTDYQYMQRMAGQCGYVFYVEPGPAPLQSIAYFGPDIRLPIPQPALSINFDAATNVDQLSFSLDGLAKKIKVVTVYDPVTMKVPIPLPIPNINILKPPLGLRPTPPAKVEFSDSLATLPLAEAAKRIIGDLMSSATAISGNGSLDVLRYGHILRARMLVGVRGAGLAYDGMYFVETVTHSINRGEYKQNFTLSRDGLIASTPVVPV
jgi:hypothetical protein